MGNSLMQHGRNKRSSIAQDYEEVRIGKAASFFVQESPDVKVSESSLKVCAIVNEGTEDDIRFAAGWGQPYPLPAQVPIGFQESPEPPYPPPPPSPVMQPRIVQHPPQPELGIQVEPVVVSRQPNNMIASPVLIEPAIVPRQQPVGIASADRIRSRERVKSQPRGRSVRRLKSRSKSRSNTRSKSRSSGSKVRSKPKVARAKTRSKSRSQPRTARGKAATPSLSISSQSMKPARNLNGPAGQRLQTAKSAKGGPKPRKKKGCCC